jgi:hypothetical protein
MNDSIINFIKLIPGLSWKEIQVIVNYKISIL